MNMPMGNFGGFNGGRGLGLGRALRGMGQDEKIQVKITWEMVRRIGRYFIPYWPHMLLVLVCIGASSLLGLVPPYMTKNIIDHALPEKDLRHLGLLILISLGATVLQSLIEVLENYLNVWISKYITYDIRNNMFRHLEKMSFGFFSNERPGEIITRMSSDIGGIQGVFEGTAVNLVSNVFILGTTAAMLFLMNWKLAVLGMFVLPLFILPTKKVGRVRWKIAAQTQEKTAQLNQIIQEALSISGNLLMKLFTREENEFREFEKANREVTDLQIRESIAGRWFRMVIGIFTTMGPMLIYFYGGYLFIKGEITVGSIIAFVAMLARLYRPVAQLTNIHVDIIRSMALFDRIFNYFDRKGEPQDTPDAMELTRVRGRIEFRNVKFSYKEGQDTLKDVSFRVEPGQMVALVGPSGAGKSTITHLISRLYDAGEGAILIDGVDIRHITMKSLRQNIGVVTQESYLFNGTILENLFYAKKEASMEEIHAACKAANIHDFILSLPQGYDTVVGNRGMKLSGGEKQRLSIARVILKNPKIIILDEATSSLDTISEVLIQQAMAELFKDRTGLVIAHRLSTIVSSDKILVVAEGKIVEEGTHAELLARNGVYSELYRTQIKA